MIVKVLIEHPDEFEPSIIRRVKEEYDHPSPIGLLNGKYVIISNSPDQEDDATSYSVLT